MSTLLNTLLALFAPSVLRRRIRHAHEVARQMCLAAVVTGDPFARTRKALDPRPWLLPDDLSVDETECAYCGQWKPAWASACREHEGIDPRECTGTACYCGQCEADPFECPICGIGFSDLDRETRQCTPCVKSGAWFDRFGAVA